MRRLVAGSLVASMLVLSSFTLVGGQGDPVTPPAEVRTTPGSLSNMIDDVDVPWEILEYIQMKYEGHAVTKAEKVRRGTSELYRLRVDRDDVPTDYESIAVLFDMKWKLVGEEKYAIPPPPPPKVDHKPKTDNQDKKEIKKPQANEQNNEDDKPDEFVGGRGAGTEPTEEQPVEEEVVKEEEITEPSATNSPSDS